MWGTCDVSYMYRYADPIAGRHEAHLRKVTRSGVKPAHAKDQVNEIAEATQQIKKSGRSHLSCNDNNNWCGIKCKYQSPKVNSFVGLG